VALTPARPAAAPRALVLALAGLAAACQEGTAARMVGYDDLVEAQATHELEERGVTGRVAVAPFWAGATLLRGPEADPQLAREATIAVARHLADALAARGLDVIAPSELAGALDMPEYAVGALDPSAVAWVAQREFDAGEVVLGEVLRYRERQGGAAGATVPAAVTFDVVLVAAPGGATLWKARFDEVQTALLQNVFHASRYPGGGTRWLTADEIARWGAEAVAAAMPERAEQPAVGAPAGQTP
jgi:hypothetical protein